MTSPEVRDATSGDAAACAALSGRYVRTTAASFELEPPSTEAVGRRIVRCQTSHAWLVAGADEAVDGFAHGTRFSDRPAYRWSCEDLLPAEVTPSESR